VPNVKRPGPESTLDDVQARLIEVALDALVTGGIEIGLEAIRLSDAIRDAGVTRATAYRSLAHPDRSPQEQLRHQVLRGLLRRDSRSVNRDIIHAALTAEIEDRFDDVNSPDIAVRTALLRDVVRVGSNASHRTITTSSERAILIAAYGAIRSQGSDLDFERSELRNGERDFTAEFSAMYTEMMNLFHLQLRPGLSIEHFTTACAAMAEGLAMRADVNDWANEVPIQDAGGNVEQEWTLFALGVCALVRSLFEPADPENPTVDLTLL